jgi:hypothetical protein
MSFYLKKTVLILYKDSLCILESDVRVVTEHEELARLKYCPSQGQHTDIKQLRFFQCCQDCYTDVTRLPRPSLCKRGTVLGRQSGVHRLAIDQVAPCGLLPRGKTRTCSQGHTCCMNVYLNTLERISA